MSEREYDTLLIELGAKVMDSWDAWSSGDGAITVATRAGIASTLEAHRRKYGTSGGGPPNVQDSHSLDPSHNRQRDNGCGNRVSNVPWPSLG